VTDGKAVPKKNGRPYLYSEKITDAICERLAKGDSLADICREVAMPTATSVYHWLNIHPGFSEKYARARVVQADVLFDQIIKIADTPVIGIKTITKPTGTETTEGDMIEHRRLQVDARKWVASKLAPKKYGEKVTQEIIGDANNPIAVKDVSPRELIASRIAGLSVILRPSGDTSGSDGSTG
jgi:hypothetical protein